MCQDRLSNLVISESNIADVLDFSKLIDKSAAKKSRKVIL